MKERALDKSTRAVFIFVTIWTIVQIGRFVAIPLMMDVVDGKENEAWMFPAALDVVVAAASFFVLYAIWAKRTLATWVYCFVYQIISIIDHIDGAVAASMSTAPSFFGGPERGMLGLVASLLAPGMIDAVALVLLSRARVRSTFFQLAT